MSARLDPKRVYRCPVCGNERTGEGWAKLGVRYDDILCAGSEPTRLVPVERDRQAGGEG